MSDTLRLMYDKFGTSRAVFIGVKNDDGNIEFQATNHYDANSVDLDHNDPVVKRMVANYSETFNMQTKKFEKQSFDTIALRDIYNDIKNAFLSASPLKNPRMSKLYKWMYENIERLEYEEGMIALYRYVSTSTGNSFRFKDGPDNPHAKNLVAILEKMREKYERR